jgi:DNA invertase Pin-like site-specific DNA recombinase
VPKTRAIGYVRVSTAEQVSGFGIEAQEYAIREHAKQHGLRLLRVTRDEGQSGSNGLDTRPGLAAELAALEAHEAEMLLVYRYDRLSRDLIMQEITIRQLEAVGVSVVSVTEPEMVDADDHTRTLVRQVLGAVSQYEKAVIRSRMAAGRAAKGAKGGYAYGRPPFGWRAVGGELEPDEGEQATIARVFQLHNEGQSLREIAIVLTRENRKPKAGTMWHPPQVQRILQHDKRR